MRIVKRSTVRLVKLGINEKGVEHCAKLIASGAVDRASEWTYEFADDGTDMAEFSKWFLCEDGMATPGTKGRFKYLFGKGDGKVYRSALIAVRAAAARQGDGIAFAAAGKYIDQIDGTKNYSGAKALPMRQQAWATLDLKAVTETDTHYVYEGVASTPTPDRAADVVEPLGADYDIPMPFLWQHDPYSPVGEVFKAKPTKDGIPVSFRIPKLDTPGKLKDRLDEAVQSIALKLVRGLSIGFSPVEYSYMEDTGGYRFIKWLWLELSAVTIPCNAEATIKSIKSFDVKSLPASRQKRVRVDLKAGVTAKAESHRDIHINVRRRK